MTEYKSGSRGYRIVHSGNARLEEEQKKAQINQHNADDEVIGMSCMAIIAILVVLIPIALPYLISLFR